MPSRFSRAGCWARALRGQTIDDAATPLANAMNSRRRIEGLIEVTALGRPWTLLPFVTHVRFGSLADILRCPAMSVSPPIADVDLRASDVR